MKPLLTCCMRNICDLKCKWKYTYKREHLNLGSSYMLFAEYSVNDDNEICTFRDRWWCSDFVYLQWEDKCR